MGVDKESTSFQHMAYLEKKFATMKTDWKYTRIQDTQLK